MLIGKIKGASAVRLLKQFGASPSQLRREVARLRRRGVPWRKANSIIYDSNAAIAGYRCGVDIIQRNQTSVSAS